MLSFPPWFHSGDDRAFLEAVLNVAAQALSSGDPVAKLAEEFATDTISPAGLALCAAEALRLVTANIAQEKAHAVLAEFSSLSGFLAGVVSVEGKNVTERTLRHLKATERVYRLIDW